MNRQGYLKVIATLLLVGLVFFGVVLVQALDRLRQSNLELVRRLDRLAGQMASREFGPAAATDAAFAAAPSSPFANLEFFDPRALSGGRLVRATAADTQNMNVLINNDATVAEFHAVANSALAARNYARPEEFEPLMAESWEISPDKTRFHIRLRKGILWHDFTDPVTGKVWKNREVTAADFKFFLDVVRNPDVNCEPQRVYYQNLDKIEVLNDYEFVVTWKEPYYGAIAATLDMSPLPRHLYHAYDGSFDGKRFNDDHVRNRILVGCGPYRFDHWEKDVRVVFTRFENYFGNAAGIRPPLDTLTYELIKLPNTRFLALLAGQLDQLGLTPEQWVQRTDRPEFADGRLVKYKYLSRVYSYISYNLRNPLFADRRVRQALTMLIDRERILREVYFNLGEVVAGPFFPGSVYADDTLKPWPYDVERAKALLAEAGWRDTDGDGILDKDGLKFIFSIMQVNVSATQQKMLPMIKESMARAGIEMKIEPLEWSVCLQRIEARKFDSCAMAWTMPLDPDLYQVWHSSQADAPGGSNYIGYRNPELDALIEELRRTFDLEKRVEITRRMARILHEDQPYTFLLVPYNLSVYSGRYRNIRVFPGGIHSDIIWDSTVAHPAAR